MIELRGLHLGNIARSPVESVRPDLWPDHAWVPALGCTGGVLYDLCGAARATASKGTWTPGGLLNGSVYTDLKATSMFSDHYSIHYVIDSAIYYAVMMALSGSSGNLLHGGSGGYNVDVIQFSVDYSVQNLVLKSHNLYPSSRAINPYAISIVRRGNSAEMYINGVQETAYMLKQDGVGTPLYGAETLLRLAGDEYGQPMDGTMRAVLLLPYAITSANVADLAADPLLPFRRRQPVFYSVPSGGGSTETPAAMMMAL